MLRFAFADTDNLYKFGAHYFACFAAADTSFDAEAGDIAADKGCDKVADTSVAVAGPHYNRTRSAEVGRSAVEGVGTIDNRKRTAAVAGDMVASFHMGVVEGGMCNLEPEQDADMADSCNNYNYYILGIGAPALVRPVGFGGCLKDIVAVVLTRKSLHHCGYLHRLGVAKVVYHLRIMMMFQLLKCHPCNYL